VVLDAIDQKEGVPGGMLTEEDDVEIHALRARGWSLSAISRHTGRDRETIAKYLNGEGPGQQRRGKAPTVEIDHPPGEEIQWDWLELPNTPWGRPAYLLVGALSHSGRWRGVFCEQMTLGHLAGALHQVLEALGGTPRVWRVDRMATAVIPGTDRLNPQFAQMAKHYGADVAVCPAHRPQRKGVVEAAIRFIGGGWWRTAKATAMLEAQQSLDAFAAGTSDARRRCGTTVGELGAAEPLRALPALAFPAQITVERVCSRSALVAFEATATASRSASPAGGSWFAPGSASRPCASSPRPTSAMEPQWPRRSASPSTTIAPSSAPGTRLTRPSGCARTPTSRPLPRR
jgi:hypothetical protein